MARVALAVVVLADVRAATRSDLDAVAAGMLAMQKQVLNMAAGLLALHEELASELAGIGLPLSASAIAPKLRERLAELVALNRGGGVDAYRAQQAAQGIVVP